MRGALACWEIKRDDEQSMTCWSVFSVTAKRRGEERDTVLCFSESGNAISVTLSVGLELCYYVSIVRRVPRCLKKREIYSWVVVLVLIFASRGRSYP